MLVIYTSDFCSVHQEIIKKPHYFPRADYDAEKCNSSIIYTAKEEPCRQGCAEGLSKGGWAALGSGWVDSAGRCWA